MQEISPQTLQTWILDGVPLFLLDVREDWEFQIGHLPNSVPIPLHDLANRLNDIPDNCPIVTICHHGVRSFHAGLYLKNAGFDSIYSLAGGVAAWARVIDPSFPQY